MTIKKHSADLVEQSVALAEFAAKSLKVAERLAKRKVVEGISLTDFERAIAADLPELTAPLKKKLMKESSTFTIAETSRLLIALADGLLNGRPLRRPTIGFIAKKLSDCLIASLVPAMRPTASTPKPTHALYRFKITLRGFKPTIWRRIEVKDCLLDQFHEHIQTAMGWTNSHLHHFRVGQQLYGDPARLKESMEELGYQDSTLTTLSDILPNAGNRFVFDYEYDFGDGWTHQIWFEGCPSVTPKTKYPICLAGERACPPEDCGGVLGYVDFLDAIHDKQHEEHATMLQWLGGRFNPEKFDAKKATREMRKGLPHW